MFSREAQALMEAAVDAIVVIDHRGMMTAVNDAAQEMFGYRNDELLGENVGLLMPEFVGKGRDVVARRKSGASFPVLLSVGRIPDSEPARFVGYIRDNSVQARREDEARAMQERLTNVARVATLGELAAGIAHELNQPLTAINAYARACERFIALPEPDLAELRDAVREIGAEALRAGTMIQRIRRIVRAEVGNHGPVEPDALIKDLAMLIAADARSYGTQLRYQLASGGARVKADGVQLQQVILNLVRNAFEALAAQPPESRLLEIATVVIDGDLEITVTDNGPGVAASIAERIFEPFCSSKPGGTGLGLAISRTIVQAQGGSVGNRPIAPHGACFYVRLPALEEPTR